MNSFEKPFSGDPFDSYYRKPFESDSAPDQDPYEGFYQDPESELVWRERYSKKTEIDPDTMYPLEVQFVKALDDIPEETLDSYGLAKKDLDYIRQKSQLRNRRDLNCHSPENTIFRDALIGLIRLDQDQEDGVIIGSEKMRAEWMAYYVKEQGLDIETLPIDMRTRGSLATRVL